MPGTLQSDLDLLIGQWQGSEKLGALIQVYRDIVVEDIIPAFETLRDMRKIESAVGVHLEYLGRRLGVGRPSTTDPSQDSRFGFDAAGTSFDQAPFRGARANDAVYPLPDAVYRQFLRARAITLLSDGSIEALKASVHAIDPGAAVQDRRNMTVRVVTDRRAFLELADDHDCLARNAGVELDFADRGRFGFDDAGVGFDRGPFTGI